MDQIEQLMDKIAERKLYLNDKNLEQSIWILLDNLNLLKLLLVAETDYSHFFIKLRKLNRVTAKLDSQFLVDDPAD